MYTCEYDNII